MQNVSHPAFIFGGPEGNRTPVRKPLDMTFFADSLSLDFPTHPPADRQGKQVALLCMTGSRAKDRCTFTTDLTPAVGRGPPTGDGRLKNRGTAIKQPEQQFCCRLLFKVEQFYGITRPAALIMPQNPRRNHYGPMRRWNFPPFSKIK